MSEKRCGNCYHYTYGCGGTCWELDINPLDPYNYFCDGMYWKKNGDVE